MGDEPRARVRAHAVRIRDICRRIRAEVSTGWPAPFRPGPCRVRADTAETSTVGRPPGHVELRTDATALVEADTAITTSWSSRSVTQVPYTFAGN